MDSRLSLDHTSGCITGRVSSAEGQHEAAAPAEREIVRVFVSPPLSEAHLEMHEAVVAELERTPQVIVIGGGSLELEAVQQLLADDRGSFSDSLPLTMRLSPWGDGSSEICGQVDTPRSRRGWYQQFAGRGGKAPRY